MIFGTRKKITISSLQIVIIAFVVCVLVGIAIVFFLHVQALQEIALQKEQFSSVQDNVEPIDVDQSENNGEQSISIPIQPLPLNGTWKTDTAYEIAWNKPRDISVTTYSVVLVNTTTGKEEIVTENTTGTSELVTVSSDLFSEMLDYKKNGNDSFYIILRGREKGIVVAETVSPPITINGTIRSAAGDIIESNTDVRVQAEITNSEITQIQKAVSGTADIYRITYYFDVHVDGIGDEVYIDKNIFVDSNASAVQKGFGYYFASAPPADAVDVSSAIATDAQLGDYGYKIKVGDTEQFVISFTVEALAPVVEMQIRLNTVGWSGIDSPARYSEYFADNAVQSVSMVSRKTVSVGKPTYERIGLRPSQLTSETREKLYIYEITAPNDSSLYLESQSLFVKSENLTIQNLHIEIDPRSDRGVSTNNKEYVGTLNSGTFVADGSIVTIPLSREVVIPAGSTTRFTLYGDMGSVGENAYISIRHPSLTDSYIRS